MKTIFILLCLSIALSGCALFKKETLKEGKCTIDKTASKAVCEIPIPAEVLK